MTPSSAGGAVELVDALVRRAIDARATDAHFDPAHATLRVRFRIDGLLEDIESLPAAVAPNVVARLKVLAGLLTYRNDIPQEGSIAADAAFGCDIRVATLPTAAGERVVLRLMANAAQRLGLDELGHSERLIEHLRHALSATQGLLVVCGPASSGKSTTLYAMLDYLRHQRCSASILTIEDPVEMRIDGVTQVKLEPARGLTYPLVLRSALRQDPQILMIGELRDREVAEICVEAALTGHLVLTTLHAASPAGAIVRLREMGIPPYQLTSTVAGVLSQRLLRTQTGTPPTLRGRTAIGQFVELSPALRAAVLANADADTLAESETGTGSLRHDAERLLALGRTTPEEIDRVLGAE